MSQNRYYVTLGVQYKHEPHPFLPATMSNPDGFLIVRADSENEAREITQNVIGTAYSFIYTEDDFKRGYHPLGCLGEILHGVYLTPAMQAIRDLAAADDETLRLAVDAMAPDDRLRLRVLLEGRAWS